MIGDDLSHAECRDAIDRILPRPGSSIRPAATDILTQDNHVDGVISIWKLLAEGDSRGRGLRLLT